MSFFKGDYETRMDLYYYSIPTSSYKFSIKGGHPYSIPAVLPPVTKGLDSVKGQDVIPTPVNSQGDSLRWSMVKMKPPTGNHTFNINTN